MTSCQIVMPKAMISDYTIKAVKDIPFTSVLESNGIAYKKSGREAITLCPWHNDKNPSLTVNDDKNLCFCFVCQIGKDSIGFIQQSFGLNFSDAVERIASLHEIKIIHENIDPQLAAKEAARKNQFYDQLRQQQESFRSFLKDSRAARIRDILDKRMILPSTSKFFGLGYSPNGFFADRITIPIHDHIGNLIGFSGRVTKDDMKPKYKNTENSEYFDKSKIVFNEFRATQSIREADSVIFVEGHFDVISMWQHGIKNVVAMQGTAAPSDSVLHRLSRKTKRFILCYDADEGGKKAIEKFAKAASHLAYSGEITIAIAVLPRGLDPDQCLRDGNIDMATLIENSMPWFDWQIEQLTSNLNIEDAAAFMQTEKDVKQIINSIQSHALREFYIDKASKLMGLEGADLSKIAKSWSKSLSVIKQDRNWFHPTIVETRMLAEKRLLRLYINDIDSRPQCYKVMESIKFPAYAWLWQRIVECEAYSDPSDLRSILIAILCICEPHYTRQLRNIAMPTIRVTSDPAIIEHASLVMSSDHG